MAIDQLARWLSRRAPRFHRLVQTPARFAMAHLGLTPYWSGREHFNYYREVVRLARQYVPAGTHVIDVGAQDTAVLPQLTWFPHRVALDPTWAPRRAGIERVRADFRTYEPPVVFDLVLCLQVLEHLDDPAPFARKLLRIGRTAIITVPYRWPVGFCETHKQDPVDEEKLARWTDREPCEMRIVNDGVDRLVAVYTS